MKRAGFENTIGRMKVFVGRLDGRHETCCPPPDAEPVVCQPWGEQQHAQPEPQLGAADPLAACAHVPTNHASVPAARYTPSYTVHTVGVLLPTRTKTLLFPRIALVCMLR